MKVRLVYSLNKECHIAKKYTILHAQIYIFAPYL